MSPSRSMVGYSSGEVGPNFASSSRRCSRSCSSATPSRIRAGLPWLFRSDSGMRSTSVAVRPRRSCTARIRAGSRRSPRDATAAALVESIRRVGKSSRDGKVPPRCSSIAARSSASQNNRWAAIPFADQAPSASGSSTWSSGTADSVFNSSSRSACHQYSNRCASDQSRSDCPPAELGVCRPVARLPNGTSMTPLALNDDPFAVLAPDLAQRIGDLSQRRRLLDGVKHQRDQILIRGGGLLDRVQRGRHRGLVATVS